MVGGVGVVVRVRLGDAHRHAVGENRDEDENVKGPEDAVKKNIYKHLSTRGAAEAQEGYFHSTRARAALRMGLLRVRQQRARGALRADLFACIAFLAPPPRFLDEPVDPRVSDLPPSPPGGASVKHNAAIRFMQSQAGRRGNYSKGRVTGGAVM